MCGCRRSAIGPVLDCLQPPQALCWNFRMSNDRLRSSAPERRVLPFRGGPGRAPVSPVPDLARYERGDGADDYRHRMMVNMAAFVAVLALIAAGLWLADRMAQMRRDQDCVLSGRRGCTPVEFEPQRR